MQGMIVGFLFYTLGISWWLGKKLHRINIWI